MWHRTHFIGSLACSAIGIVALFLWLYSSLVSYTPADEVEYWQLQAEANPALIKKEERSPYIATQHHNAICKDYFYMQGQERLQVQLRSQTADVTVDHNGSETELIERMGQVVGYMQEQLLTAQDGKPMQMIRYFEAEGATYSYKSGKFHAERVRIFRYQVPGHTLKTALEPFAPLMQGTCETLDFALRKGTPDFKASGFKASMELYKGAL
jgi:hypothetical protein